MAGLARGLFLKQRHKRARKLSNYTPNYSSLLSKLKLLRVNLPVPTNYQYVV